jgi:hypothetical protein
MIALRASSQNTKSESEFVIRNEFLHQRRQDEVTLSLPVNAK